MMIVLFLYFGFLLPYLVGRACNRVFSWRKSYIGVTSAHGIGLIVLFAIFYVVSFVPLSRGMAVSELAHWMSLLGYGIGIVSLLVLNRKLWQDAHAAKVAWPVIALAIIALICSVLFLRPDSMDVTGEMVRRMVDSNVFYGVTPYTGEAWLGTNHSPVEAIYGIGAVLMGIDPLVYLHRLTPVALLVAYFGVYLEIGTILFGEDNRTRDTFLAIVIGIYGLEVFREGQPLLNVLCNPWNGQTLLGSMILPMAFAMAYQWIRTKCWQCLLFAGCLLVVAQLCYGDGAMMVAFLWAVAIVVAFVLKRMARRKAA